MFKQERFRQTTEQNEARELAGKESTTDLDVSVLPYIFFWSASSPDNSVSTLDVTAAFLNLLYFLKQSLWCFDHHLCSTKTSVVTTRLGFGGAQGHLLSKRGSES